MKNKVFATISTTKTLSSDVKLIELNFPGDNAIGFEPGGHLDVEVSIDGEVHLRSYSLVGLSTDGALQIAVKLADQSRGGSKYMWQLEPGTRLAIWPARNTLPVTFTAQNYVLIAGGIGITPLIGIARTLKAANKDFTFYYCVRDAADAPFIDDLRSEFPTELRINDDGADGLLDCAEVVEQTRENTMLYMCGPIPLMDAVNRAWRDLKRPVNNLRFETFGNSGRMPSNTFEVEVVETGAVVTVPANMNMLDALIAAGQPMMFECKRGECGLCKVEIDHLDGEIDHRDVFLSEREKEQNKAMCCCVSRVFGNRVKVRIDDITHGGG